MFFILLAVTPTIAMADNAISELKATTINLFRPKIGKSPSLLVKDGYCMGESIATNRYRALRCMVDNEIFDPCFVVGWSKKIVCQISPVENKSAFILKLTKPLPKIANQKKPIKPWMMTLADGTKCRAFTGTLPILSVKPENIALQYECDKDASGLMAGILLDSIKPGKIWQAKKVTYTSPVNKKNMKIQDVIIEQIWY